MDTLTEIQFRSFDEFAESLGGFIEEPGRCSSCIRDVPRLTQERECERCVSYTHGVEQARQEVAQSLRTVLGALLNGERFDAE